MPLVVWWLSVLCIHTHTRAEQVHVASRVLARCYSRMEQAAWALVPF